MVEKVITVGPNVIEFARYRSGRAVGKVAAAALSTRTCRHCNAALAEGENEDECSGALSTIAPRLRGGPRKFYAE